jgi:hypothetical protein
VQECTPDAAAAPSPLHASHSPASSAPSPPPPPAVFSAVHSKDHVFDTSECDLFTGNSGLDRFLDVTCMSKSVHLILHDVDPYVAHAAIRHATSIPTTDHSIFVAIPMALRKDRAFTPWLSKGVTLERAKQSNAVSAEMCLMVFNTSTKHVHA